jgi:hypothetical protein
VGDETFDEIRAKEFEWIKTRRDKAGTGGKSPEKDAVGLGISGGGIRSATFNLGLLQAMERYGLLKHVDYMSTVSGGGYIGSCLTWLMTKLKQFPFGTSRKDHDRLGGSVLAWLRAHGKYLVPGEGLNVWALTSATLTGILVSVLVMAPVLLMLFNGLAWETGWNQYMPSAFHFFIKSHGDVLLIYFFLLGLAFLAAWLFAVLLLTVLPGFIRGLRKSGAQKKIRIFTGNLLKLAGLLILLGTIPIVYGFIAVHMKDWIDAAMSGVSVTGILALIGGKGKAKAGSEVKGGRSFLLSFGLTLLVFGLFLWFYHLGLGKRDLRWMLPLIGLSLFLAVLANINHVSMHRFYRNRLMQAYMPAKLFIREDKEGKEYMQDEEIGNPDKFYIKDIKDTRAPYHIVNTNVTTVGSKDYRLCGRGGDNFIFSPLYCGSDATKYIETGKYAGGKMNLATAFSISGAAVNPNSYVTRSRPLSFLMTLLNIRMGYWIDNPARMWKHRFFIRPMWYLYMFAEMFGSGLKETHRQIHLSDGGHFENLAFYELIRRRVPFVIISDAGADKDYKFGDLSKLIEMVRLDFGAKVTIENIGHLTPEGEDRLAEKPFVYGTVEYGDKKEKTHFIYVKTTMVKGLPQDLYTYRREHKDFPDQSTMDQFFDEKQFEAYRELGFSVGAQLCEGFDEKKLKEFFTGKKKEKKE